MQRDAADEAGDTRQIALLPEDGVEAKVVDSDAADLVGRLEAKEAVTPGLPEHLTRDDARGFPVIEMREHFAAEEGAERLGELEMLIVIQGAAHRPDAMRRVCRNGLDSCRYR